MFYFAKQMTGEKKKKCYFFYIQRSKCFSPIKAVEEKKKLET